MPPTLDDPLRIPCTDSMRPLQPGTQLLNHHSVVSSLFLDSWPQPVDLSHLALPLEVEVAEWPGWLWEDMLERMFASNEQDCMIETSVGESETYCRSGVEEFDDHLEDVDADGEGVVWW